MLTRKGEPQEMQYITHNDRFNSLITVLPHIVLSCPFLETIFTNKTVFSLIGIPANSAVDLTKNNR